MLFDPTLLTQHKPGPLDRGSRLRRWLARLFVLALIGIGIGAAAPVAFGAVLDLSAPGEGWGWAFVLMGVGGLVATVCAALLPGAAGSGAAGPPAGRS